MVFFSNAVLIRQAVFACNHNRYGLTGVIRRWNLYLKNDLGHLRLDRLTAGQITATLDLRITEAGLKPATRHRALALIRRIINASIESGAFSGPNPCRQVRHIPYDNTMNDWLTAEEVKRLLAALDADVNRRAALAIRLMVFSGRRKGEVLGMHWTDLSDDRSVLTIPATNSKTKKQHVCPLNGPARSVIAEAESMRISDLMFPCTTGRYLHDIYKPWKRIKKASGISCRLHGLRHTAAATLVQNGESLYTVSKVLCHSNIRTTERYAHLAPGVVQGAADRLGELLGD